MQGFPSILILNMTATNDVQGAATYSGQCRHIQRVKDPVHMRETEALYSGLFYKTR